MSAQTLRPTPALHQRLAPKLITQLKIAELSLGELSEYARREIHNNPLLQNDTNNFDKKINEALASRNSDFNKSRCGSYASHEPSPVIIADAEIHTRKNSLDIRFNERAIPKLNLNPLYRKILENQNSPPETKEFVREELKKALTFIEAIKKRQSSLKKIICFIVETQKDFLMGKTIQMRPLSLSDLAKETNLHVSTISRIVRQKYVLINNTAIPLRALLSYSFKKSPSLSTKGVLYRLKEILRDSKAKKSLSDRKLSLQLLKEGIPISRRTVAKYRKMLGAPSSLKQKPV